MNNKNWLDLVLQLFVPLTFFAIWAISAVFNRESKGFVIRPPGPRTASGVRPGDPTLRWGSTAPDTQRTSTTTRRVPLGDDDILIIPSDANRPARPAQSRSQQPTARRLAKGRMTVATPKKPEPVTSRPRLGGVTQIVNQQLARPVDMRPLTSIAPMTTSSGSDLANSPTAPSKTSTILTVSTLIPLMNDPMRLREAFIVNELFQRPLALRDRRGPRA